MNNIKSKKTVIAIIIGVLILAAAFGLFYLSKTNNKSDSDGNNPVSGGNSVFTLLDAKKDMVWEKKMNLTDEVRNFYSEKIKNLKEKISKEKKESELIVLYNNLALYESYLGEYKESYRSYLKALKLKSDYRVIWLSFGDLLVKMKAFKSAEAAYEKAISLNKYIGLNYIKLANLYKTENSKNYDKIEQAYKQGIKNTEQSLNESDNALLREYAGWLGDIGRKEQAVKIYEKLKEKQPQNSKALDREINKLK